MADVVRQLGELQQQYTDKCTACTSAEHKLDRAAAARRQAELVAAELAERAQGQDARIQQLQARCVGLEAELARMQSNSITAEHVSQQLEKVEALYRSRVEAIKGDCREKLAAQDGAARARLVEAQAETTELLARVKRAALQEVQRAEAFLEGKVGWQAVAQTQKPVRNKAANWASGTSARVVELRSELVAQAQSLVQTQLDAAAARQAVVLVEERLEAAEATCRMLRTENVAIRQQLVALTTTRPPMGASAGPAPGRESLAATDVETSREREAAAQAAALQAAQADAGAREMLEGARREQVATSLALLAQLRRVQALEAMRLSDLQ
ncbi:hypothetical protein TSOC_003394, partial [Tetrabaena socialis]